MLDERPENEFNMFLSPDDEATDHTITDSDTNRGFCPDPRGQKRRAKTWGKEETHCLINLREKFHDFFNSSNSNKYLWDQISARMREMGWERTASMCTEKWRNLLKEFKKAKDQGGAMWVSKVSIYDEVQGYFSQKEKNLLTNKMRADFYFQFPDRGVDETSFSFGPVEAEPVIANRVPAWNCRRTPRIGGENESAYIDSGRVISVKLGESTKRIGIDGSSETIKEAIKSTFGLRTNRAFWLEDEDETVRTLDREMPLRNYTLHLDEGLTIKFCLSVDPNHIPCHTVEKTFYTQDDFSTFLRCRGWISVRGLRCNRHVDTLDDLKSDEVYHGLRLETN